MYISMQICAAAPDGSRVCSPPTIRMRMCINILVYVYCAYLSVPPRAKCAAKLERIIAN